GDKMATERRGYPWRESAILLAAAIFGYAIKLPFGLIANRLFNPSAPAGFTSWGYVFMALQLAAVIAGLAIYHRTTLPRAPWLERRLYGTHAGEKLLIWRPALVGMLIAMAVTVAVSIASAKLGLTSSKLGSQLHASNLPEGTIVKLIALYGLAAIGAPLSEEAV